MGLRLDPWTVWQGRLLGPFLTCIWAISKQMHTHLPFLGRRAENLRILVGNLCCSKKLNPSWKQHKRVCIKDLTFCLLLESVARPPASLLPFIKASATFFVQLSLWAGDFHCPELSRVYFIFQQWFPFHPNLLSWLKMCFFIQNISSVGMGKKKKNVWKPFGGNLTK